FRAGRNAPARAGLHGHGVPWFAHAETIEMSGLEIGDHLWRWHDDDTHIAIWVNARSQQPASQKKIVRREREHDTERKCSFMTRAENLLLQCRAVAHAAFPEFFRK